MKKTSKKKINKKKTLRKNINKKKTLRKNINKKGGSKDFIVSNPIYNSIFEDKIVGYEKVFEWNFSSNYQVQLRDLLDDSNLTIDNLFNNKNFYELLEIFKIIIKKISKQNEPQNYLKLNNCIIGLLKLFYSYQKKIEKYNINRLE